MATETRPDDVSGRAHDDAWPPPATEIGLLALFADAGAGIVVLMAFVLKTADSVIEFIAR